MEEKWTKKSLKKNLYICAFAFMVNYAAYAGLIFIQSSINHEEGLGIHGLFVVYITSSISTITILPSFIDFCGAKAAIIAGEVGITVFTIANFYPNWYTITAAAIIHGVTESASWAGSAVYVSYLGEKYWKIKKDKRSKEECVYNFFSRFYSVSYFAQIIGNGLVSAVFFGHSVKEPQTTNMTFNLSNLNDDWSNCGAKQCQINSNETWQSSPKYNPESSAIFILLSVFLLMQIIFTLIHVFGLKRIAPKFSLSDKQTNTLEDLNPINKSELKKLSKSFFNNLKKELSDTLKHLVSKLHICVIPIYFLYGILQAFYVTEFTRAYVSCTIGVNQLGFVMMVFGVSDIVISALFIKLLPLVGRNILFYLVLIIHLCASVYSLFFPTSVSSTWIIYLGSVLYGACDAGYQNILQGLIAIYFENSLAIAYSIKNLIVNIGIVFGTSSLFNCVYSNLQFQLGMLLSVSIFYILAEIIFKRMKKTTTNNVPIENSLLT